MSDQVFERSRKMIASGELSACDTVPTERALIALFGVGRPAVREAPQLMRSKGFPTIAYGERSRVDALTAGAAFNQLDDFAMLLVSNEPPDIDQLKKIRHILEMGTVRLAAQKRTSQDVEELTGLVEAQR